MIGLVFALVTASSTVTTTDPTGLSYVEQLVLSDALVLEGELEACEVRERGLEERLPVRRAPAPASSGLLPPPVAESSPPSFELLAGVAGVALAAAALAAILAAGAL